MDSDGREQERARFDALADKVQAQALQAAELDGKMKTLEANLETALERFRTDFEKLRTDMAKRDKDSAAGLAANTRWLVGFTLGVSVLAVAVIGLLWRLAGAG